MSAILQSIFLHIAYLRPLGLVRDLRLAFGFRSNHVRVAMISATQFNHPMVGADMPPVDQFCMRLKQARMRITKPRVSILKTLAAKQAPITIEKLHTSLQNRRCDLVTVYRCLAAFEKLGLVRRSFLHSGTCLYELSLKESPDRYLVVYRQCNHMDPVY